MRLQALRKGFGLLEVLIVCIIGGIILTLAIPKVDDNLQKACCYLPGYS